MYYPASDDELEEIFLKRLNKMVLTKEEELKFKTAFMLFVGKEYHKLEIKVDDHNNIMVTSEKIKADYNLAKTAKAVSVSNENVNDEPLYDKYMFYENKVQDWLNQPIGTLSRALLPTDKLDMAYNGTPIADFINRVQLYFSGAQVSAVGLANDIAGFKEKVSTRDIIATYPFPNTLVVFNITGKNLKLAMERSAEYFAYDADGKLTISDKFLSPKVEHYNYDYFAGVDYKIDPSKPIGSRIVKLEYQGKPVTDKQMLTLCLNNYRASGAGEYPMYKECTIAKEINIEMSSFSWNISESILLLKFNMHFKPVIIRTDVL